MQNVSTDFVKSFLTEVFTLNKENRYTTFDNTAVNAPEDTAVALNTYYSGISSFLTDDCLSQLKKNRIPVKYDIEAEKENTEIKSVEISVSAVGENRYTFELSLVTTDSANSFNGRKFSGDITLENTDKGFIVDSFYVTAE